LPVVEGEGGSHPTAPIVVDLMEGGTSEDSTVPDSSPTKDELPPSEDCSWEDLHAIAQDHIPHCLSRLVSSLDRYNCRVSSIRHPKAAFRVWRKVTYLIGFIRDKVPLPVLHLLQVDDAVLWKLFVIYCPSSDRGSIASMLVKDRGSREGQAKSTNTIIDRIENSILLDFEGLWQLLIDIDICPFLIR